MKKQKLNQTGVVHLVVVIILAVVVGLIGYTAFRIFQEKNSEITAENAEQKAKDSPVKMKTSALTSITTTLQPTKLAI